EEVGKRHRVDEAVAWHVAIAAIARGRPGEALRDEVLANGRQAYAQSRSVRAAVGDEAVRVQHQLAVPRGRDLDAVPAAVVLPEERLRARQRVKTWILTLPRLARAGDWCDAWPSKCCERRHRQSGSAGYDRGQRDRRSDPKHRPA